MYGPLVAAPSGFSSFNWSGRQQVCGAGLFRAVVQGFEVFGHCFHGLIPALG